MINQNLLDDLKAFSEKGPHSPSDSLVLFEFAKVVADKNDNIKEELEEMERFVIQFDVVDQDYKFWLKAGDGILDYGEGDTNAATFTMSSNMTIWNALTRGVLTIIAAFLSGGLNFEGSLRDMITLSELLLIIIEEYKELIE